MTQAQLAQGNAPLLAVRDVSVVFGGIIALNGVSFDMHKGAILGLIGPNGAGKTTLFNCLSRLYQPSSGDILMEGASILTRPPHRIAEIGIGRTFQNVALFPNLSVLDNVRVGTHSRTSSDIVSRLAEARQGSPHRSRVNKKVHEILDYLDSMTSPTPWCRACRSAPRSASSWRARSPPIQKSCCSTSPPAASTTRKSMCSAI
jgi:branched-chain amino acid transport system ATP-binding protein